VVREAEVSNELALHEGERFFSVYKKEGMPTNMNKDKRGYSINCNPLILWRPKDYGIEYWEIDLNINDI
jgi:hypothetical protein